MITVWNLCALLYSVELNPSSLVKKIPFMNVAGQINHFSVIIQNSRWDVILTNTIFGYHDGEVMVITSIPNASTANVTDYLRALRYMYYVTIGAVSMKT